MTLRHGEIVYHRHNAYIFLFSTSGFPSMLKLHQTIDLTPIFDTIAFYYENWPRKIWPSSVGHGLSKMIPGQLAIRLKIWHKCAIIIDWND